MKVLKHSGIIEAKIIMVLDYDGGMEYSGIIIYENRISRWEDKEVLEVDCTDSYMIYCH